MSPKWIDSRLLWCNSLAPRPHLVYFGANPPTLLLNQQQLRSTADRPRYPPTILTTYPRLDDKAATESKRLDATSPVATNFRYGESKTGPCPYPNPFGVSTITPSINAPQATPRNSRQHAHPTTPPPGSTADRSRMCRFRVLTCRFHHPTTTHSADLYR